MPSAESKSVSDYLKEQASAHVFDVRSLVVLLAAYSIGIFFVDTWAGMAAYAAIFFACLAISKVSMSKTFKAAIPVYVIVLLTVIFNMFPYVDGSVQFDYSGLFRGLFFASRILLLVWMSLIFCLSITQTELVSALISLLKPLGHLHIPIEDFAMIASIVLRFIPFTIEEFFMIRDVQWARGAHFDEGSFVSRLKSYFAIFIPMFISMFRRADTLAVAMDARVYGNGCTQTQLRIRKVTFSSIIAVIVGVASIALTSYLL